MPFQNRITACLVNNCKALQVTDSTGVYNATNNASGWQNALTLLAANVTLARILITFPDETSQTETVTTQIPDPVTGTFRFNDIFPSGKSAWPDGLYTIRYEITDNSTPAVVYIFDYKVLFSCNVECCVDKLYVSIAEAACGDCDCDLDELIYNANRARSLVLALKSSAASSLNSDARTNILAMIQRICDGEDCNCR